MPNPFSTGSPDLDALLEELRAGDNVVIATPDWPTYEPFVRSVLAHRTGDAPRMVYARSAGRLDALVAAAPGVEVLDLAACAGPGDPVARLQGRMREIGPGAFYLFESLHTLAPLLTAPESLGRFFTSVCPFLFQLDTICYWHLEPAAHDAATVAAIKDCTQVYLQVDRLDEAMVLTPLKVWGRYSAAMFRPHRVLPVGDRLTLHPLSITRGEQEAYAAMLEDKNRELAAIRDAVDETNRALQERNRQLADLNARLQEQTRRHQALHTNLDHLQDLLQAGQAISSSLVVERVREAIVAAGRRLLDAPACRLTLAGREGEAVAEGLAPPWRALLASPDAAALRERVGQRLEPGACRVLGADGDGLGSVAIAPLVARGECLGLLEVSAPDERLASGDALALLGRLASESSIALDNASLYREVESQGQQLRSFVEEVITKAEQESRRFALDLHDGLVQLIVAAYQHLQSAQAWRTRDPAVEERELEQGNLLLRRAIYEARRLIAQLRPTGLDDFGLVHALRLYVAQIAGDADWETALDVSPDWPALPYTLEAALFRIVQEASTNALKYARSPRLRIALSVADGRLGVVVQDWGQGFDPSGVNEDPERGRRLGLIGMRERARLWGGECRVASGPGQGTTIAVSIPIPQTPPAEEGSAP